MVLALGKSFRGQIVKIHTLYHLDLSTMTPLKILIPLFISLINDWATNNVSIRNDFERLVCHANYSSMNLKFV